MNNDFNYTPPRQTTPPPSDDRQEEQAPPPQIVTSHRKGGAARLFWKFLAILLFLALLGAAAYIVHEKHLKPLRADNIRLQQQVADLQNSTDTKDTKDTEAKEKPAETTQPVTQFAILTGSASAITTTSATVAAVRGDGNITALWIESGTDPKALTTVSKKETLGIAEGAPGSYVEREISLTGLKPGTRYFYRAAATQDGKTVYGGISSFETTK